MISDNVGRAEPPNWHFFSGTDLTQNSVFAHQGLVWAPDGHLHESGWRVRGLVSGGAHLYQRGGFDIIGQSLAGEIMPGYEWMGQGRGGKFYLGASVENHQTLPPDPGRTDLGTRSGAAALAEAWFRVSEALVLDASAGFGMAGRSYSLRLAARWEAADLLALEPEALVFGEAEYRQTRLGLFADLYDSEGLRVQLGGGWAFDDDGDGPYGGVRLKRWR